MFFMTMDIWRSSLLLTFLFTLSSRINAANILGLFPHTSEGHFSVMKSLVSELAKRNHNVTIYTGHRLSERLENVTEYIIVPEYLFWDKVKQNIKFKEALMKENKEADIDLLRYHSIVGAANIDNFLGNYLVQDLIKLSTQDFNYDLILVDFYYSEALLSFGLIHQKPTIVLLNNNFENYMQNFLEVLVPSPCSHLNFASANKQLSFYQKHFKSGCIKRRTLYDTEFFPQQLKIIKKYFPKLKLPVENSSVQEMLLSDVAVYLMNNHIPLWKPRPLLYNVFPVGGLHIRQPQELPWNIKKHLDEARFGVIYIYLGNEQLCKEVPLKKVRMLYEAFKNRRVIWTCHDEDSVLNPPKSWLIQHMVPHADILAHPHVRVFITNGELLNLQEGIVRHVPMIGLPIFSEQIYNIRMATEMGIALHLEERNLTTEALQWAANELIKNPDYGLAIRQISAAFRERPFGGLEHSMFWIDYVLRHNGATYLKTIGTGKPLESFPSLVPILFFIILILLVLLIALLIFRRKEQKLSKIN